MSSKKVEPAPAPMEPKNLLVDGSFESAGIGAGKWTTYNSVGGWNSDTGVEIWGKDFITSASDGDKVMELDADRRASAVWQDVQTEKGAEYTFNFDYAQRPGTAAATNTIQVYWNGELVGSIEPGSTKWSTAEFKVKGTGGIDRIEFREEAGDNDSLGGVIDNASLVKTAEAPAPIEAKRNNDDDKHDGRGHGDGDHNDDGHTDNGQDGKGRGRDRKDGDDQDGRDRDEDRGHEGRGKRNNDDDKHDGRGHGDGDHNDDGHTDNGHDGKGKGKGHDGDGCDKDDDQEGGGVDPLPPVDELPVDPLPPVDELPVDPLPPVDELPVNPVPPVDEVVRSIVLKAEDINEAWTGDSLIGSRDADGMNGGAGDDHIQGRQGDDKINGDDVGSFTSRLNISASISDQVSPDDVRLVISGMPADAVLSAGVRNADGSWTLKGSELDGLMISAPDATEFKLHITATDGGKLEASTDIKVTLLGGFNDIIEGGRGNDVLNGQAGDDVIYGGSKPTGVIKAPPLVPSAEDNDWIDAGDGNDVVYAGSGNDTVFGGTGKDWISGGRGDDLIAGQDDDDVINGNSGNDMIWGDAGNDEIVGGSGNDTIWGGEGDDVIKGGSGDDIFYTDAGTDSIFGGSGFDTLVFSSDPSDTNTYVVNLSEGFVGNSEVGFDTISSIEAVIGGYGNDLMIGSTKANLLVGGAGGDVLRGGAGADTLTGGEGNDTFVFLGKDVAKLGGGSLGMDVITDFEVGDVVDLTDLTATRKAVYSLKDDGQSTILLAQIKGQMVEVVKFEDFTGHSLDDMINSGMLLV